MPSRARLVALVCVALLPQHAKRWCYRRLFGYVIGRGVRIGFTLIHARSVTIGDHATIGHGNIVFGVGRLDVGDHVRIGHLNIIRGGAEVMLGRYVDILRRNELNSMPEPDAVDPTDPRLFVGAGSVITTGHKIDFTDRVHIGRRSILGGRNSSLWTHNRQRTAPIHVGDLVYLGSEIRMAPGSAVPSRTIVAMGAVVVDVMEEEGQLVAGVPARPVKPLSDDDLFLTERKTRLDLPEDI